MSYLPSTDTAQRATILQPTSPLFIEVQLRSTVRKEARMAAHRRQPSVSLAPHPQDTNQTGSSPHFIFVMGSDSDFLPVQLHYKYAAQSPGPHQCPYKGITQAIAACPHCAPDRRLGDYFSSRNPVRRSFSAIFSTKEGGPCFDTFWRPPSLAFKVREARAPPPR
jgi:hypothetical protein